MGTSASHVVAALCPFDKHLALGAAFPVFEVGLEILVARATVLNHFTLFAVLCSTFIAGIQRF